MPERPSQRRSGQARARVAQLAQRYPLLRAGLGIQAEYRDAGGGLIVGGLAYAALFALIPTLVLAVALLNLLIDDPQLRADAVDLIADAFPALESLAEPAVESATEYAGLGAIVALATFAWGASGLHVSLTRAMERFFPGERVSTVMARVLGVLLVALIIVGVLAALVVSGVVTVIARALAIDADWLLGVVGGLLTLVVATALAYGVYRLLPTAPPSRSATRLPALLVGITIGLMTLFYGLLSPWLVSSFQAFGVMASVFVALVWLRLAFMAVVYGAAMTRYRDGDSSRLTPDIVAHDDGSMLDLPGQEPPSGTGAGP